MKGEYGEEKDHPHSNMFASKLHQAHRFQQSSPPPSPLPHHHHPHQHQFQLAIDRQTSEETDSRSPGKRETEPPSTLLLSGVFTNDGSSIEVVRRPRGRPPGSKNKPKPPVIIAHDNDPSMTPHVLELPGGVDIVDSITRFCRNRNMGLCVLTGSGTVGSVTLRQPSTTSGAFTFHGRFNILSISATILPSSMSSLTAPANGFTVCLTGAQGQVVGGLVAGPLLAVGTVYVIAASFNNPLYHRLPLEDDPTTPVGSGGNEGGRQSSPPASCGGGGESGHPSATSEPCGIPVYGGCHLPSDVIWAPSPRHPPPPPPPF